MKFHSHAAPAGPRTPRPTSARAARQRRRTAPESLGDIAYAGIRERITSLALPPGSAVNEAALAAELGVGLAPVRSALRRLAWENLVVILPRRGTLVTELDVADIAEIFELRVELEGLSARLAGERADDEQRASLSDLIERTRGALAEGDQKALIELDRELHAAIAEAAGNTLLEAQLDWLYSHVLRLWSVTLDRIDALRASVAEHESVVEAIVRGDPDEAYERMQAHVRRFQAAFLESENARPASGRQRERSE
ncbi:MAG TPA: GntR family transcriptional regulator [Gaiellales bacterium]